jgi:hypothetical protein
MWALGIGLAVDRLARRVAIGAVCRRTRRRMSSETHREREPEPYRRSTIHLHDKPSAACCPEPPLSQP